MCRLLSEWFEAVGIVQYKIFQVFIYFNFAMGMKEKYTEYIDNA